MADRNSSWLKSKTFGVAVVSGLLAAMSSAPMVLSQNSQGNNNQNGIRRVLLISIDGMHALDYENCVNSIPKTCPHLAALGAAGVNYTRTSASKPSDSAPGLAALVTGGTPRSTGIYYDVAYDRVLAPPKRTTGNGVIGSLDAQALGVHGVPQCIPNGVPVGTTTEYEEGVDFDQNQLNGGGPGLGPFDGNYTAINPN